MAAAEVYRHLLHLQQQVLLPGAPKGPLKDAIKAIDTKLLQKLLRSSEKGAPRGPPKVKTNA